MVAQKLVGLLQRNIQMTDTEMISRDAKLHYYVRSVILWILIIRPHRNVGAAYCYRPSSVVCLLVCHTSEPYKNGCNDRDAVWVEDSGGPKEPCIRWGPDPSWEGTILRGGGRVVPL